MIFSIDKILLLIATFGLIFSCRGVNTQTDHLSADGQSDNSGDRTDEVAVINEIPVPEGFSRWDAEPGSFADYLQHLELDTADHIVHLYNGEPKYNQGVHYAIVDMDVGERDLQQCADAVMRLYAEYLFHHDKADDISFNFTSGDAVAFSKYADGFRPSVNGSNVRWQRTHREDHSYQSFRKYMDLIFTYAGSYSLSKELEFVGEMGDITPGDVLIQGGFPGHAVIVLDVIVNVSTQERGFLLAQSYMPAQEIHVLINPGDDNRSPWYSIPESDLIRTPEWTFIKGNLMRFKGH